MIVRHIKTGKDHPITPEAWAKIKASGKSDAYRVLDAPELPKELKNVHSPKKGKTVKTDHTNGEYPNIDDRLPGEDAREIE